MNKKFQIGKKIISENKPIFIIAEVGVNHNGDVKIAKKLIKLAKKSGVNAIKFQTFFPEEGISKHAPLAEYQSKSTSVKTQLEMVNKLQLTQKNFLDLKNYAEKLNLIFLSTPFDVKSVKLLNDLKTLAYKISSGDITNKLLLEKVAECKKPMIISTGMSNMREIQEAIKWITNKGCKSFSIMQCTSNYPTKIEDCNLLAIKNMKEKFDVQVGFSDHTKNSIASILAMGLGISFIEKHITLDHNMEGPDHKMSLDPKELKNFVNDIRDAETALGSGNKECLPCEIEVKKLVRKSIVVLRDVKKDEILSNNDLGLKRPGIGMEPKNLHKLIGRKVRRDISADELIDKKDLY